MQGYGWRLASLANKERTVEQVHICPSAYLRLMLGQWVPARMWFRDADAREARAAPETRPGGIA